MFLCLLTATALVGATVVIHFGGIAFIRWLLLTRHRRYQPQRPAARGGAAILFVVFCLLTLHSIEIWIYAAVYLALGALPDLESAVYFSTASFTTIGYGDVVLPPGWRLLGTIEGANGLMLFGWSTAFLTSVVAKVPLVGSDW